MLFSVISSFDAAYTAYNDYQSAIERFWTLRWLQQHDLPEIDAAVLKDGLVRADALPLVFKALGCESLPRGAHVRVRITGIDLLTLDLHASLAARLDEVPAAAADADTEADDEDAAQAAAPLALAIDMADAGEATGAPDASEPGPAA
jgi:exoribonuclease-2